MSTGESEQQQGLGCLTLTGIFVFICWSIDIVALVTHPPIDFLSLSINTTIFALYLFLLSPWGRPLLRRSYLIAMSPLLLFIFFSMYLYLKPYPFNSPQAIFSILSVSVLLFSLTPWFKYVRRWFPPFLIVFIILSGMLITYPLATHRPVDSLKLFFVLSVLIGMLAFVLLFLRFTWELSMRLDKTKNRNFSLGRAHFPQEGATTPEKPVVDIHFLGVSLQIFRFGKFTRITLSTD